MSEMIPAGKQGTQEGKKAAGTAAKTFCKIKNMRCVLRVCGGRGAHARIKPFATCFRPFHFVPARAQQRGRQGRQGEKDRYFSNILSNVPLFLTFRYVKDTLLSGADTA
jgi:hypothetical protein